MGEVYAVIWSRFASSCSRINFIAEVNLLLWSKCVCRAMRKHFFPLPTFAFYSLATQREGVCLYKAGRETVYVVWWKRLVEVLEVFPRSESKHVWQSKRFPLYKYKCLLVYSYVYSYSFLENICVVISE